MFGSPVQSGLLAISGKTETETGLLNFKLETFSRWISTEIEVAKENEVIELFWIGTVESVGFL